MMPAMLRTVVSGLAEAISHVRFRPRDVSQCNGESGFDVPRFATGMVAIDVGQRQLFTPFLRTRQSFHVRLLHDPNRYATMQDLGSFEAFFAVFCRRSD